MHRTLLLIAAALILSACNKQFSHPDTSGIDLKISVDPFYKAVFATSNPHALNSQYSDIFADYCSRELHIGRPGDADFDDNFRQFIEYPDNAEVIAACDSLFDKLTTLDDQLTDAFQCFAYYFPDIAIPHVYCHFSGFNSKIIVDSTYVSFSIEHYLGADCRFYQWLEVPQYARRAKQPDNITPDIVKAWLYANYPDQSDRDDILAAMLYQGRILYCLARILPDIDRTLLLGFTEQQLQWCQNAEAQMWGFLVEQQLLYSTNLINRRKLINEAPFTTYFGQQSPGRAVLYCAFNIICQYMQHNPDTTLDQLLSLTDPQQILLQAHYRP